MEVASQLKTFFTVQVSNVLQASGREVSDVAWPTYNQLIPGPTVNQFKYKGAEWNKAGAEG